MRPVTPADLLWQTEWALSGGLIYFGGHFDKDKIDAYRLELRDRVNLCRWAVEVMNDLRPKVAKLAIDA